MQPFNIKEQYKKTRKRLLNRKSYWKKKGYAFYDIPENVKNPTPLDVAELQNTILEMDEHLINTETGELRSSEKGQDYFNAGSDDESIKAWKQIIDTYLDNLSEVSTYKNYASDVIGEVKSWITKYGEKNVAYMLQDGASHGVIITYEVLYKEEEKDSYLATMFRFLPLSDQTRERAFSEYSEL